jgi:hypothetical protein
MPSAGFEPAIPATKRQQTYAIIMTIMINIIITTITRAATTTDSSSVLSKIKPI